MRLVELSRRLQKETGGLAALEYGLIAGFLTLAIVAGMLIAQPAISLIYSKTGSNLTSGCASIGGSSC